MEWISVKERLPDFTGNVLAVDTKRRVRLMIYDDDDKDFMTHNGLVIEVTHWMPLPEPPKGE